MKKAEFIKATAAKAGVSQKEAQIVVAAAHEVIKDALKKGDTVPFLGFGTFKVSNRAARTGRNPQTGEAIKIAAAKLPTFKASPAFKEFINNVKKAVAAKKAAKKKKDEDTGGMFGKMGIDLGNLGGLAESVLKTIGLAGKSVK